MQRKTQGSGDVLSLTLDVTVRPRQSGPLPMGLQHVTFM
jgi:hypothetical protein